MKKIICSTLAVATLFSFTACDEGRLDIDQKGVTAVENYYKTAGDAEAALVAAYADFSTNVTGRGAGYIYTPYKFLLNNGGDDMYAAGSNFGDNDFSAALNEYRYDTGLGIIYELYSGLFKSVYTSNLVIDNFKNGIADGTNPESVKRCVAEARVLRAYDYFLLAALFNTPPMVDHVLDGGALPYNCDTDPNNPMTHDQLMAWVANECVEAAANLDERKDKTDKDATVKCTKGFAWALAGKAYVFLKDWDNAITYLKKVIDSDKYALVPGEKYWQNFHVEGDCNEEKIFESNIEYNSGIGVWGGINQRSTWMEANIWNWRSDHFANPPQAKYSGIDGWGGLGVPQWFGDEFFANDGHSYRFDCTFKHVDDAIYGMDYTAQQAFIFKKAQADDDAATKQKIQHDNDSIALAEQAFYTQYSAYADTTHSATKSDSTVTYKFQVKNVPAATLASAKFVGIKDPQEGLYGQSFWLPFKQMLRTTDVNNSYGNNVRLNNNIVMRYAEVLLLYAEACIMKNDNPTAKTYINMIQNRAGSQTVSDAVDMDVLKKEKAYELWLEGSRRLDIIRWGDTEKIEAAGSDVPKLFDKLYRAPKDADVNVKWENGTEATSRFYTVSTHAAKDAGYLCGFKKNKHEYFPIPQTVRDKNPNMHQNPGWE